MQGSAAFHKEVEAVIDLKHYKTPPKYISIPVELTFPLIRKTGGFKACLPYGESPKTLMLHSAPPFSGVFNQETFLHIQRVCLHCRLLICSLHGSSFHKI